MAHDVIKGVFEGEEETGLCMELLCAPALGDEIDMLQPNRPQTHVDTPLAGYGLQREISHVIFEGQTVLRTELNQGVRSLAVSLLIGDRNREFYILLGTGSAMAARRIAGSHSVLIPRPPLSWLSPVILE